MPMFDYLCGNNHATEHYVPNLATYECPPCVECGEPMVRTVLPTRTGGTISDSIPGGILIEHGLCNPDGSPRRYDSYSDINREARKRGMENYVVHQPPPGTDRSPHTSRWV